jgi:hypothetical protein
MPTPKRDDTLHQPHTGRASEFVRQQARTAQDRIVRSPLEELLAEGITSGRGVKATPNFWKALKAEATAKARPQA